LERKHGLFDNSWTCELEKPDAHVTRSILALGIACAQPLTWHTAYVRIIIRLIDAPIAKGQYGAAHCVSDHVVVEGHDNRPYGADRSDGRPDLQPRRVVPKPSERARRGGIVRAAASRPPADPERALALIGQARDLLEDPNPRWSVTANPISHDEPASGEELLRETAMRLLVEIGRDVEAIDAQRREFSTREDIQAKALRLRANGARLAAIIEAVTGVHALGEVAS
jgi:hypothetical protein